ncbi:MAG: hypothetical protein IPJ06_08485 [Saprospiraceae bacterium]|nr:hypothetical protein [Saprospiraceae bacterium]
MEIAAAVAVDSAAVDNHPPFRHIYREAIRLPAGGFFYFANIPYLDLMRYGQFLLAAFLFTSCVGQRHIHPLIKDETAIGLQAGGPLIKSSDRTFPIPFSALYVTHGLDNGWMADIGLHTTALLYKTIYLDPGGQKTWIFPQGIRPGLNTGIRLNTMTDLSVNRWRFYPQADLHLWWSARQSRRVGYVGMTHWFDPHTDPTQHQSTYQFWRPAFYLGYQIRKTDWDFSLESKWLAPGNDNRMNALEYTASGDAGALGFYLTIQYRFF